MKRRILALLLILPFLTTAAALAGTTAGAVEGTAVQAVANQQPTTPLLEPALCQALLAAPTRALAVPGAATAIDQTALCTRCPVNAGTCDGYPYCYVGNDCCCPLKGICNCVCW